MGNSRTTVLQNSRHEAEGVFAQSLGQFLPLVYMNAWRKKIGGNARELKPPRGIAVFGLFRVNDFDTLRRLRLPEASGSIVACMKRE